MPALPKGSTFPIATNFAGSLVLSSISNAIDALATTAVPHTLVDGDIVEVLSGWTRVNRRIYKIDMIDATTFKLLGLDSTNTGLYPPGSSLGSIRKITEWTAIPK